MRIRREGSQQGYNKSKPYMTDGKYKWVGWVTDETVDLLSFCLQETVSERISEEYKVFDFSPRRDSE
jgi:hypothetical protein